MKLVFALMLSIISISCADNVNLSTLPAEKPVGTWYYVGNFYHTADYKCLVCPDFDKENAYKITFNADGTLKATVGFLLLEGKYETTSGKNQQIKFPTIQRMNKPLETFPQTEFINNLGKTNVYSFSKEEKYDQSLIINVSNDNQLGEYLYFVR